MWGEVGGVSWVEKREKRSTYLNKTDLEEMLFARPFLFIFFLSCFII